MVSTFLMIGLVFIGMALLMALLYIGGYAVIFLLPLMILVFAIVGIAAMIKAVFEKKGE